MIGCAVSWKCAVACLFGDWSQQPIFPQIWHMRRCTHQPPVLRHSSQPAISAGNSVTRISPRCVQLTATARLPVDPDAGGEVPKSCLRLGLLVAGHVEPFLLQE